MREYRLAEGEAKFAKLIWDNEPVGSMQLVKLSEMQLGWKKSTTYTVLKKLCDRGLFQNADAGGVCEWKEQAVCGGEL